MKFGEVFGLTNTIYEKSLYQIYIFLINLIEVFIHMCTILGSVKIVTINRVITIKALHVL